VAELRPDSISTVLCDLDGVVWLAHRPIAGSVGAVERLRASGRRVLFVTNNSASRVEDHEASLAAIGIAAEGDVISSAMAAASLVEAAEHVLVTGGPGIVQAVEARGASAVINDGSEPSGSVQRCDAVVVGLDTSFDYARLRRAGRALHHGARLIGSNPDTTYPTPHGLDPGGGSIVQAVAAVGGVEPTYAGKPEQPMADLILARIGSPDPASVLMVGDRPDTDGLFAHRLGAHFGLVETGVTDSDSRVDVEVALRRADLAAIADVLN